MGRAHEVRKVAMEKTAAAKSKLYAKYGKEIYMAAKSGSPDPDTNQVLKKIIEKAKREQVTADIIKRAIEKAVGGSDENYIEVRYEGFGPGTSMIIVECLTDNVNRTISTVRNAFTKTGGKLGVSGSTLHQFNHVAVFSVPEFTEDEMLETLVMNDLNFSELEVDDESATVIGEASDYNAIRTAITDAKPEIDFTTDELMWLPIMEATLDNDEDLGKFDRLIQMLDELDDVQNVYHNIKL
jgi:YebC/PmpR family DNA-binding regulatory protein